MADKSNFKATPEEIDALADRMILWRADPVLFAREMCQFEPTGQQERVLQAIAKPGAHVAVKSGHGVGKSACAAIILLWGLTCYEGARIACTAPTGHQLQDVLWPEVRIWSKRLLPPWGDAVRVSIDRVNFDSDTQADVDISFAVARTGRKESPEALQGMHSTTFMLFLIDEASGVPDNVFEVAEGALSTEGARVLMLSNPTRTSGYFYNAFHRARNYWDTFTFSCLDSPLVGPKYAQKMADTHGDDSDTYKIRVLGEFPSGSAAQFIKPALAEAALERIIRDDEYMFAPVVLGVDVAMYGSDRSVIAMRQGQYCEILWSSASIELLPMTDIIMYYWDTYEAIGVYVDVCGIGAATVSTLHTMGRTPIPVNSAEASGKPEYYNKRAEMWGNMRDWMRGGGKIAVPNKWREIVKDDLIGPEYGYDPRHNRVKLERKEDMRKRGIASPDFADAIAMTFAYPIKPPEKDDAPTSYNIFANGQPVPITGNRERTESVYQAMANKREHIFTALRNGG